MVTAAAATVRTARAARRLAPPRKKGKKMDTAVIKHGRVSEIFGKINTLTTRVTNFRYIIYYTSFAE